MMTRRVPAGPLLTCGPPKGHVIKSGTLTPTVLITMTVMV